MKQTCGILISCLFLLRLSAIGNPNSSRVAVPDSGAQQSAEKSIRSIFASDYSHHAPESKRQLAAKLLNQASQTNSDMPGKYVLLHEAQALAASAGDVDTALTAADALSAAFDVDAPLNEIGVLADCAKAAAGNDSFRVIANRGLKLGRELSEARPDISLRALEIAGSAARRAKALDLALAAENLTTGIRDLQEEAKSLAEAADRLKANASDPQANLLIGEDFCFRKQRWDLGLPLLARGSDPALKAISQRDLANPSGLGDQIQLGDDWWDLGKKQSGARRTQMLARGYLFLKRALPRSQDLQRLAIEKRLAEAPFVGEAPGEVMRFSGHASPVMMVRFASDGRYALSSSADGVIRMWDILNGHEIRRFEGHTGPVIRLSIANAGHRFISNSYDHTARVWDLDSGREIHLFQYGNDVNASAISPDEKLVLIADNMSPARLYDPSTGKSAANFGGEGSYASAWSASGRCFASGGWDGFSNVFDAHTLKQLCRLPQEGQVYALALSRDGHRLLSSGPNRIVRFWDLDHGTELCNFEGSAGVIGDVALSPDNRFAMAAGSESNLRIWDLFAGRAPKEFAGHTEAIKGVCFSPDGRLALTGSADGTARVWRLPEPE